LSKPRTTRISEIVLDADTVQRRTPNIEREREVAIYDLLEDNHFVPAGVEGGPYALTLGITENRLVFDIRATHGDGRRRVGLSLTPFRKLVKDYFLVCDSYYAAIRDAPPSRIEAIDMGRRGLHDEGSRLLQQRLKGKAECDFDTARRLFTLICVLHMRE
jgi:uncharacterized protein (UPF0262 family)